MQIALNSVVTLDYVLRDGDGEIIDQSDGDPLVYLHGHGNIVPGLEEALEGKKTGESVKAVVAPRDGYGERSTEDPIAIPRAQLDGDMDPQPGMELGATGPDGVEISLFIVGSDKENVFVTYDHPLAGVTLHFDVDVRNVRAATAEEIEHGHVHGPHGHH